MVVYQKILDCGKLPPRHVLGKILYRVRGNSRIVHTELNKTPLHCSYVGVSEGVRKEEADAPYR